MPYICRDCPNKTKFEEDVYGSCQWSERREVDEDGEDDDSGDTEYDNYETDGRENISCAECDSTSVEDVEDTEWEEWEGPVPEGTLPKEKQKTENWKDYLKRTKK